MTRSGRLLLAILIGFGLGPAVGFVAPSRTEAADCDIYACYQLFFSPNGQGSGSIVSTNSSYVPDGNLNCVWTNGTLADGADCEHSYPDEYGQGYVYAYYTVTPAIGSIACDGSTCLTSASNVIRDVRVPVTTLPITFGLRIFDIAVTTQGSGSVISNPSGIDCGATCAREFAYGTAVTLTATPAAGSIFQKWTGACAGQDATCAFAMPADNVFLTATFKLAPQPTPRATAGAAPTAPTVSAPAAPSPATSPTGEPNATAAPTNAGPIASLPPVVTTATDDVTSSALAILAAAVLLGLGIAVVGLVLARRRQPERRGG